MKATPTTGLGSWREIALAAGAALSVPALVYVVTLLWGVAWPEYPARAHFLEAMAARGRYPRRGPPGAHVDLWGHKVWFDWDRCARGKGSYWHSTGPNGRYGGKHGNDPDDVRFLRAGWDVSHRIYYHLPRLAGIAGLGAFLPLLFSGYLRPCAPALEVVGVLGSSLVIALGCVAYLANAKVLDSLATYPYASVAEALLGSRLVPSWLPASLRLPWLTGQFALPIALLIGGFRVWARPTSEGSE